MGLDDPFLTLDDGCLTTDFLEDPQGSEDLSGSSSGHRLPSRSEAATSLRGCARARASGIVPCSVFCGGTTLFAALLLAWLVKEKAASSPRDLEQEPRRERQGSAGGRNFPRVFTRVIVSGRTPPLGCRLTSCGASSSTVSSGPNRVRQEPLLRAQGNPRDLQTLGRVERHHVTRSGSASLGIRDGILVESVISPPEEPSTSASRRTCSSPRL